MLLRYLPPGTDAGLLEGLSRLRGEVFYSGGRRPAFLDEAGRPRDDDALDAVSHHVVALRDGVPVGCARLVPLEAHWESLFEWASGSETMEHVARSNGLARHQVFEAGRMAVRPGTPGLLAMRLVAALTALAAREGRPLLVLATGTRSGKHERLFRRRGFTRACEDGAWSDSWDDEIVAMQRWVWPLDPLEVRMAGEIVV